MTERATPEASSGEDGLEEELAVLRAGSDPEDAEEGDTTAIRAVRAESVATPDDDATVIVDADVDAAVEGAGDVRTADEPHASGEQDDDSTTNPMGARTESDGDTTAIIGGVRHPAATPAAQDVPALDAPAPRSRAEVPTDPVQPGGITVKPVMVAPTKRRRRTLRPAPVPPGYGGRALLAPGAGAVSTYRVREIPRPPASVQPLATRAVDRLTEGVASVSKRSRRLSILAMGGFALSIAVSVTGLVLIARSVILGY